MIDPRFLRKTFLGCKTGKRTLTYKRAENRDGWVKRSSILFMYLFEETPYWEDRSKGGKRDISVILSTTKNIFKNMRHWGMEVEEVNGKKRGRLSTIQINLKKKKGQKSNL